MPGDGPEEQSPSGSSSGAFFRRCCGELPANATPANRLMQATHCSNRSGSASRRPILERLSWSGCPSPFDQPQKSQQQTEGEKETNKQIDQPVPKKKESLGRPVEVKRSEGDNGQQRTER
jgi:hypothetical protein